MPLEMKEEVSTKMDPYLADQAFGSRVESAKAYPDSEDRLPHDGFTILHAYPSRPVELKWMECLRHCTSPAHYASPAFFLEPYFRGKNSFAVLALCNGEVVGVLTGLHEHGAVVSGLETRVHIAIDARQDLNQVALRLQQGVKQESKGVQMIQVYSWSHRPLAPFVKSGFRRREFPGNPVLDLSLGAEKLLKQCNSKRRNCIRFAMKSGLEIVEATAKEEFDAFYDIYEQWCTAKGIFRYPKEMEWEAIETTRANRLLLIAKYEGKIVAGSVFRFFPGGLVEYSRNSSLPEFLRLKPNDLLVWSAVEWACKNGFTHFSMGGNHRFLREFGGQMQPIDRYRMDRTLLRRHDLNDAFHDLSRAIFHRLPSGCEEKVRRILRREKPAGW